MIHLRKWIGACVAISLLVGGCAPLPKLALPNFSLFKGGLPAVNTAGCPGITVGIVIGAEGTSAAQEQQEGYDLAAKEINDGGGVAGCRMRLVYNRNEGEGSNPDAVQAAMLELADSGVAAVLGATTNDASKRIAAISQYIKTPVIVTADTADDLLENGSQWIFRINPSSASYAAAAFDMAQASLGPQVRAGVLYEHTEYGESAAVTAGNAALNRGFTLALYQGFSEAAENYAAMADSVYQATPDVLYLISSQPNQAAAILQAIASRQPRLAYVIGNGAAFIDHTFLYDNSGALNSGLSSLIITVPWSTDLKWQGVAEFANILEKFRSDTGLKAVYPPAIRTVQAYTAVYLIEKAIDDYAKTSKPDWNVVLSTPDKLSSFRAGLAESLRGMKAEQYESMLGPIEFDTEGQNKAEAILVQIFGTKMVTVYPKSYATQVPLRWGQ